MIEDNDSNKIAELNRENNLLGKIAAIFIERYRIVYLIIICVLIAGISIYNQLPRESMPETVMPFARISVQYPGAAPQEIESLVTDKIEAKLQELEDVYSISSTTSSGMANINIEFDDDVDLKDKEQEINSLLSEVNLPEDCSTPSAGFFSTSSMPIMRMSVAGDYDLATLKSVAEDLQSEFEKIKGVDEVDIVGGLNRQISIYVDPVEIIGLGISMSNIQTAITTAHINAPGGSLTLDGSDYDIRLEAEFASVDEIENVVIKHGDNPILLKDIATVVDGYEDADSYSAMYLADDANLNKASASVSISIYRQDGADIVGPSEQIKQIIEEGKGTLYPDDVSVLITSDEAVDVDQDLNDVINNAISGLLVIIIVLFMFIGLRESIMVAFVIPLSLLSTCIVMYYYEMTFNTITLLALIISLGLLVDNAIVILENISRIHKQGLSRKEAAKYATNQIAPAVLSSTLTTIAAFLAMAFMPGRMSDIIKIIPMVIMIVLGASLIVSITITPALCSRFIKEHTDKKSVLSPASTKIRKILSCLFIFVLALLAFARGSSISFISIAVPLLLTAAMAYKQFKMDGNGNNGASGLLQKYTDFLNKVLHSKRNKAMVLAASLLLFLMALGTYPLGLLKTGLYPPSEASSLYVSIDLATGSIMEDSIKVVNRVEELLYTYPEVESFTSDISSGDANSAQITVELVEEDQREKSSTDIQQELTRALKNIAGAEFSVATSRGGRFQTSPIVIELAGDNFDDLETRAGQYKNLLEGITGIVDPFTSIAGGPPQLTISIDRTKAAVMGLNPISISSVIKEAIQGVSAGTYLDNQDEIKIKIKWLEGKIKSTQDLEKIYFTNSSGQYIPFSAVAKVNDGLGLAQIEHKDGKRVVSVYASMDANANLGETMKAIETKAGDLPEMEGVTVSYGGDAREMQESFSSLAFSFLEALFLVFLILAIQFNSLSQPFAILLAVPLSIIGVILGLILTGNDFGVYAFMGVIALVGIAVNNAIVLLDYTNQLRAIGHEMIEALLIATKTRFVPIAATTLTTIGAILPLALKSSDYAQLAYSIIFGLFASAALTLVIIPVIYSFFEDIKLNIKNQLNVLQ
jgi:HAE1 family hydrophobic/amphiphilic exporter-1